ncbi:class I adenylate-forming enzyme family protein [Geobacter pickeringii]|uniref:AMP-dependent synthetase n=1 Tax=Geobacter pickeringii TaxID=345632 RepID=A0A0B5BA55_9BACT|nr:AMP-binding protein [Geobacter pickeringii]AJE03467.1 AMP-dependent synthetase [Geobacter pickeringii]
MLVHDFLRNSAARLPGKVALVSGRERLTYRELDERSDRLAATLVDLGMNRQDRVVILLENTAEAVVSLYGVLKAGGIFVLLNPGMKSHKLNFILKDCGARMIITHEAREDIVSEAVVGADDVRQIVWCRRTGSGPEALRSRYGTAHSLDWADVLTRPVSPAGLGRIRTVDVDLATIIYTSGSTGEPKGVMSAHYNMVAAARSISSYLKNVECDIILDTLPLSFDYGLYQVLMSCLFGGTVVLEKSFAYPYKVMETLVAERVTGFPIVPTMVAILLQMENLGRFDCGSLRYMTNTAAALPVSYIEQLQELFPHVTIYSMYGLTECKRVSYLPPEELRRRPKSVGIPIPNEEVFILDENGRELGPGEIGELVVRGANVMQGYWNRPEETARTFRPGRYRGEAYLHTGDLFRKDEDGFLYFVSRRDDMIKTRGERVSPREIENVLCGIPWVAEAAVVGVPDDIFGQAVKAFVVCNGSGCADESELLRHCAKQLEPFMIPKYVEFRNDFPKTPSGKIDKKRLASDA